MITRYELQEQDTNGTYQTVQVYDTRAEARDAARRDYPADRALELGLPQFRIRKVRFAPGDLARMDAKLFNG